MDTETPTQGALNKREDRPKPHNEPLARRIGYFRKIYGKGIGHKPTALQGAAISRAAVLTAIAEAAAINPAVSINDVVRADNAAARARAAMAALIDKPKPSTRDAVPSLAELINR